jgi:hypothetical protein
MTPGVLILLRRIPGSTVLVLTQPLLTGWMVATRVLLRDTTNGLSTLIVRVDDATLHLCAVRILGRIPIHRQSTLIVRVDDAIVHTPAVAVFTHLARHVATVIVLGKMSLNRLATVEVGRSSDARLIGINAIAHILSTVRVRISDPGRLPSAVGI